MKAKTFIYLPMEYVKVIVFFNYSDNWTTTYHRLKNNAINGVFDCKLSSSRFSENIH